MTTNAMVPYSEYGCIPQNVIGNCLGLQIRVRSLTWGTVDASPRNPPMLQLLATIKQLGESFSQLSLILVVYA